MSDHSDTRGVHVSAGDGIVAHLANLTAFAAGDETLLNELLVRLNALKDAPWHEVVRTLTAGIVESDYDAHPDLACVSITDDRVAALVFGNTSLVVTTDQTESTLNGRDSSTWIDVAVHGAVQRVQAGQQSPSVIVGVLRDGVVPAGGFLLDTSGPMPSSTRWTDTEIEPVEVESIVPSPEPPPVPVKVPEQQSAPIDAVPDVPPRARDPRPLAGIFARLDARHRESDPLPPADPTETPFDQDTLEEESAPAQEAQEDTSLAFPPPVRDQPTPSSGPQTLAPARPQLRGVLCPNGHLTQVNDVRCRECGELTDQSAEVVMGDRPILGMLTFDDGAVLAIDRPAAIGADVPSGHEVDGEPATVVRLDDGLDGVSALQVEIRTVGWDVEIHDMNSQNGTYTILRGERQTRTRLRAGQSVVLQDGMLVEVGGRSFTFTIGSTQPDDR